MELVAADSGDHYLIWTDFIWSVLILRILALFDWVWLVYHIPSHHTTVLSLSKSVKNCLMLGRFLLQLENFNEYLKTDK